MRLVNAHPWDVSVDEARSLQAELAQKVLTTTSLAPDDVRTVAAVDVGFVGERARAAVVVLRLPDLQLVHSVVAEATVRFPYVPGLLAFREGPVVLEALEALQEWPDVLIFDAQGIAHPRRLGLASHLGVILDTPSIGCAKSRLCGQHGRLGDVTGEWVPLIDQDRVIGAAVRSQAAKRPIYVSIGHRVDLPTAIDLVMRCTRCHRLPETTRLAHRLASGAGPDLDGQAGQEAVRVEGNLNRRAKRRA